MKRNHVTAFAARVDWRHAVLLGAAVGLGACETQQEFTRAIWLSQRHLQVPVEFVVVKPKRDAWNSDGSTVSVNFNPAIDKETAPPQCRPYPAAIEALPLAEREKYEAQLCVKDVVWGSQVVVSSQPDSRSELLAFTLPTSLTSEAELTPEACNVTWETCAYRWRARGPARVSARYEVQPALSVTIEGGAVGDVKIATSISPKRRNDARFVQPPCTLRLTSMACLVSANAQVDLEWAPHLTIKSGMPAVCSTAGATSCRFTMGSETRNIVLIGRR